MKDWLSTPQCDRDLLFDELCCAIRRRPAIAFLRPFNKWNLLFDEALGRKLLVISKISALAVAILKDKGGRDDFLPDDGSDAG